MNREGDIVFDSLPYIDGQLALEEAEALIEKEMKLMGRRPENEVHDTIVLFKGNPSLQETYNRAEKGQSTSSGGIDTDRFKLPTPKDEKNGDWKCSVDNAKSQLEYQESRLINLELMSKYGPNQWKLANYQLEHINKALLKEMNDVKESIQAVNRERKQEQIIAAKSINQMRQKRADLYNRIVQVRMANEKLQSTIL